MNTDNMINRRRFLAYGGIGIGSLALGRPALAAEAEGAAAATAPLKVFRWGVLPYPNTAWPELASQRGFLKKVGIALTGGVSDGTPRYLEEKQVFPLIINRNLDVSIHYMGGYLQSLNAVDDDLAVIHAHSVFYGRTILVAPDSPYKTVSELLADGMSWEEATKTAVGQMKGKTLGLLSEASALPWFEYVAAMAGLTLADIETVPLDNPKIVQLSMAGQLDFAGPNSAAHIYQLQIKNKWRPLIDMNLMMTHMPNAATEMNRFIHYDITIARRDFVENNRDDVMRALAGLYSTIAWMNGDDRNEALTEYLPIINRATGTNQDIGSLTFIFESLTPLYGWEDQKNIWLNSEHPLYYKNVYEPQIARMIKDGSLEDKTYDLDNVFVARGLYLDMQSLKEKSDSLLAGMAGSELSAEQQALVAEAKAQYASFNFLDSTRILEKIQKP